MKKPKPSSCACLPLPSPTTSTVPYYVRQKARLLAALRKLGENTFTLRLVSTPVVARVRRLRARWTAELDQEMIVMAPRRLMARYAAVKLNKKLYKKVIIRGKPARNTNAARRNRRRRRAVAA